jgi:5,10-methylenetetrahydromethanopterin reductase
VRRHGIDPEELRPVVEALGTGDIAEAVKRFRPEYAEKLSVAGTPEECVEKIKTDIQPSGVNHMILALSDAALVKLFSGEEVPNVPDINGQLRLVAERVMPAFEPAVR